jgi:tetratricopeptide (TPR) repeat protein
MRLIVAACAVSLLCCPWLCAESPADPHYLAGLAYERLGRYDDAYTELQLAFALDQDRAELALALGLVASRLGRLEPAQRALERSIALDSDSVGSYFPLALLYEKKNLPDRAEDAWHRFLSLNQDEALKAVAQKHIQYLESNGNQLHG